MEKNDAQIKFILEVINQFPDGASLEEILNALDPSPSRRTLQYRMSSLIKNGQVIAEGTTNRRKFRPYSPSLWKSSVKRSFNFVIRS